MSVIGLTLVLTQRLILIRSFHAWFDSTTSRAVDGLVLHSGSYSTQNSTQPIGGRVVSPTAMYSGCSGRSSATPAFVDASSTSAIVQTTAPGPRIVLIRELIVTPSRLVRVTFRTKLLQRR